MNIRIALCALLIATGASAMDKEGKQPQTPPNSGWFRFSSDMVAPEKPKARAPQPPAPSSNWGWFRILDHEDQETAAQAKAQVITASWLRTRDTNE